MKVYKKWSEVSSGTRPLYILHDHFTRQEKMLNTHPSLPTGLVARLSVQFPPRLQVSLSLGGSISISRANVQIDIERFS